MTAHAIATIPVIERRGETNVACRGCGAEGLLDAIAVPGDPGPSRETFVYGHCPNCGTLGLLSPPEDMSQYYPDDYYSFAVRNSSPLRTLARRARNAMTLFDATPLSSLTARLASNRSFLSLRPLFSGELDHVYNRSSAILDVGSGDGQKLYDLQELGFTDLTGVDPFMRNPQSSVHLKLIRASLDNVSGAFDILTFHHSMEHLSDPEETLRLAARLLKPGGVVVVRIPVAEGWAWRTFGGEWAQLDAPRHLHIFSRQGFDAMAARAGWRVAHTLYDSGPLQIVGSRLRMMGINFHKHPAEIKAQFDSKQVRDYARQAEALNRAGDGDQATFFLFPVSS